MKKLLLCGVALGAVAIANSASAADMPLKAPPLPGWGWAGFYAGVNVGYGWASDPATLTDTTTIDFCHLARCDRSHSHFRCQSNDYSDCRRYRQHRPQRLVGRRSGRLQLAIQIICLWC